MRKKYLIFCLFSLLSIGLSACIEKTPNGPAEYPDIENPDNENEDDTPKPEVVDFPKDNNPTQIKAFQPIPKYSGDAKIQIYDFKDFEKTGEYLISGSHYIRRSQIFEVQVKANSGNDTDWKDVYVMADRNSYQVIEPNDNWGKVMTNHNHTASFSSKGSITIRIKRRDGGTVSNAIIYPRKKNYTSTVKGEYLEIPLDNWAYIFIDFADLAGGGENEEPLFIFADPYQEDIPVASGDDNVEYLYPTMSASELKNKINSTSKKTIYFTPGIYTFNDNTTSQNYVGYKIPLKSNTRFYLPGNAMIVGSFLGDNRVSNCTFDGRGVVTACGKVRIPERPGIPFTLFRTETSGKVYLEGIHFSHPPHFCVLGEANLTTRFTKMFGWYHQTDGWGGQDNSILQDSFTKANDDNIKVYKKNMLIKNVIIYKQINGAGVQFGWGAGGVGNTCTIEDLYIVKDDCKNDGRDISNAPVLNLRGNDGGAINNIHIRNLYIENDVPRVLGLELVHDATEASFSNFCIDNLQMTGKYTFKNNYLAKKQDKGVFRDFHFRNIVIDGKKIMNDNDWDLWQVKTKNIDGKSKYNGNTTTPIKINYYE